MNTLDSITRQISGPMLGSLSSFLGAGESATRSAVGAAAPALFSALGKLASIGGGTEKLTAAIGYFDAGSVDRMMSQRPEAVVDQGAGLAESVLGGTAVSDISGSVSRSAGIGIGAARKLLGFLLPLILGGIAKNFAGRQATPQSLATFFAEHEGTRPRMPAAPRARSTGRWVVAALACLAALGLFWSVSRARTRAPEPGPPRVVDNLGRDAAGALSFLTTTLSDIRDEASAQAAIPAIRDTTSKIGALRDQADRLPEDERERFNDQIRPRLDALEEQTARVGAIPGAETIKPELDDLVARLRTSTSPEPSEVK